MRAIGCELNRLVHRKSTWWVTAALVLVIGLLSFAWLSTTAPPSAEDRAVMAQSYQEALKDWQANSATYISDCQAANQQDPAYPQDCTPDGLMPHERDYTWTPPTVEDLWSDALSSYAPLLACLLALILATTFIAAEFTSGNIATWLTFEPRRTVVYWSKLVACGVAGAVLSLLASAVTLAGAALVVGHNQGTVALSPDFWLNTGLPHIGFAVALVTAASMASGALTFIIRRSLGVIGLAIGYLIVVEQILANLIGQLQRFLLSLSMQAFINDGWGYTYMACGPNDVTGAYDCQVITDQVTRGQAAGLLGVLFVVCVGAGWLVFRRRDV